MPCKPSRPRYIFVTELAPRISGCLSWSPACQVTESLAALRPWRGVLGYASTGSNAHFTYAQRKYGSWRRGKRASRLRLCFSQPELRQERVTLVKDLPFLKGAGALIVALCRARDRVLCFYPRSVHEFPHNAYPASELPGSLVEMGKTHRVRSLHPKHRLALHFLI